VKWRNNEKIFSCGHSEKVLSIPGGREYAVSWNFNKAKDLVSHYFCGDQFQWCGILGNPKDHDLIQRAIFQFNAFIVDIYTQRVMLGLNVGGLQLKSQRADGCVAAAARQFKRDSPTLRLREQLIQSFVVRSNFSLLSANDTHYISQSIRGGLPCFVVGEELALHSGVV
jgi:hypothetical protein